MTDPFEELLDIDSMSRINETATGRETAPAPAPSCAPSPQQVREALTGRRVCPYCGLQSPESNEPCPRCRMDDTPGSRQATKARIGPWYVLQSRNPAAPGMRYTTLLTLIGKGSVQPQSVVRGPTTHQLWRYAAHVRGVSREFGLCYSCGGSIDRGAVACTYCGRSQEPPAEPDLLLDARNGSSQPSAAAAASTSSQSAPSASSAIVPVAAPAPTTAEASFSNRMRELSRQRERVEQERSTGLATVQRSQRPAAARSNERVVSAMDLAAALQEDPNRFVGESRRWGIFKFAGLMLVLAGIAGAGLLYVKPQYQAPTKDWLNGAWGSMKGLVSRATASTPAAPPTYASQTAPVVPARSLSIMSPVVSDASPTPAEPERTVIVQAKPQPSDPPPHMAPPSPAPVTPVVQSTPVDRTTAIDMARQLYRQAIDAEQKEDFAAAIRFYEQIEKLPNDAWPGDLRIRMTLVREQAAQSSAAQ